MSRIVSLLRATIGAWTRSGPADTVSCPRHATRRPSVRDIRGQPAHAPRSPGADATGPGDLEAAVCTALMAAVARGRTPLGAAELAVCDVLGVVRGVVGGMGAGRGDRDMAEQTFWDALHDHAKELTTAEALATIRMSATSRLLHVRIRATGAAQRLAAAGVPDPALGLPGGSTVRPEIVAVRRHCRLRDLVGCAVRLPRPRACDDRPSRSRRGRWCHGRLGG